MTKSAGKTEPFVMLPLGLLDSAAFRSLSVNGWRFIRFLMVEHMRRGGKANGALLAPRRQLERSGGIGSHHVSPAIEECIQAGFVDCRRGVGRHPSTYVLTWLPFGDGSAPSNRWRAVVTAEQQSLRMTAKQQSLVLPNSSHKGRSDCQTAVTKPQNKYCQTAAPYNKASYQGRSPRRGRSRLNRAGGEP